MENQASRGSLAVFPGSFDPITNGHLDIVERGLRIFERVRLAILSNPEKKPLFSIDERVALIRDTYADNSRVEVDTFSGLLVDYADTAGATVIIRGIRAISDFEYEFQMALMNRRLNPTIETVFMISRKIVMDDIRATPPSLRMSDGTRSSAITETAPAFSAISAS